MKILNCCLMEAEYDSIPDDVWERGEEYLRFLPYIGYEKNSYDEIGLELTRRNIEANPELSADVLFMTKENIRKEFQNLKAHGFAEIFQYIPEGKADFINVFKSHIKEQGSVQAVIVGQESSSRREGTTGAKIAELMRCPCIGNVVDYRIENDRKIWIKSNTEEAIITATVKTPVVLMIGEAPNVRLKTPRRRDKLSFLQQLPWQKHWKEILPEERLILDYQQNKRKCQFISVHEWEQQLSIQEGGKSACTLRR